MGNGAIYYGGAGCGKTYRLCKMASEAENPIILSFTNKAIQNIKEQFKERYQHTGLENECYTFDRYFCDYHGCDIANLQDKTIFIDEYSMTPNKWMTMLYQAFAKYHLTIYMFGDNNQRDPVEADSKIHYDYFQSVPVSEMCPKRVEMKYIPGAVRYDIQTRDLLAKFLKTGTVEHKFEPRIRSYYNICDLNSTRKKVTEKCCDRFVENRSYHEVDFKYRGVLESCKVCTGMPIRVTQNLKDKDLFNMLLVEIDGIEESGEDDDDLIFHINDQQFSYSEFRESFIPAFCVTVYKYQGGTINKHYNIYDVNKMDKKQPYTALSRTTKLEYIHLNNKKLKIKYTKSPYIKMETVNSYFNDDYNSGQIYHIIFEHNDKVYVACSIRNLQTRLQEHITDKKSPVYKYKDDNHTYYTSPV